MQTFCVQYESSFKKAQILHLPRSFVRPSLPVTANANGPNSTLLVKQAFGKKSYSTKRFAKKQNCIKQHKTLPKDNVYLQTILSIYFFLFITKHSTVLNTLNTLGCAESHSFLLMTLDSCERC